MHSVECTHLGGTMTSDLCSEPRDVPPSGRDSDDLGIDRTRLVSVLCHHRE